MLPTVGMEPASLLNAFLRLTPQEGEVDRGADISPLSYYPEEREKLYGALSMMQVLALLAAVVHLMGCVFSRGGHLCTGVAVHILTVCNVHHFRAAFPNARVRDFMAPGGTGVHSRGTPGSNTLIEYRLPFSFSALPPLSNLTSAELLDTRVSLNAT
jgi:hypothetical protein